MDEKNLRKAAVLVSTLDRETAEKLLRQLNSSQADQVRTAADQLANVSPAEQRRVLDEFLRSGSMVAGQIATTSNPEDNFEGVDMDASLAVKLSTPSSNASLASFSATEIDELDVRAPHEGKNDNSLYNARGENLAPLLGGEHPQSIAVVLSRLPVDTAADTLTRLHPALQANVARRLLDLDEAIPEVLFDVETELASTLQEKLAKTRRRETSAQNFCRILQAAPELERLKLLQILPEVASHIPQMDTTTEQPTTSSTLPTVSMTEDNCPNTITPGQNERHTHSSTREEPTQPEPRNHSLPAQPKIPQRGLPLHPVSMVAHLDDAPPSPSPDLPTSPPTTWNFLEVTNLKDDILRRVIQHIDPDVARLALIGANEAFVKRVIDLFPKSVSRQLRRQLTELDPIHLRDVELAQQEMAKIAAGLLEAAA